MTQAPLHDKQATMTFLHRRFALGLSLMAFTVLHGWAQAPSDSGTDSRIPSPIGIYATQNTGPYYFVGRVSVSFGPDDYLGSATVTRPNGVLTAAHLLWDNDYGWAYNIYFERAYYQGTSLGKLYAARKFILSGYASNVFNNGSDSDEAFNRDLGVIKLVAPPAAGAFNPSKVAVQYLKGFVPTMALGYGADLHDGEQLLRSMPALGSQNAYYPLVPHGSYYFVDGAFLEHGMSGGPLFALLGGVWTQVGVNVSGSSDGMGIRVLDKAGMAFMVKVLK